MIYTSQERKKHFQLIQAIPNNYNSLDLFGDTDFESTKVLIQLIVADYLSWMPSDDATEKDPQGSGRC